MALKLDQRWLALYILCFGDLMIVLDTTIVNVALPSIGTNLHFTEASLAWVVNAYLLTFGGFLLLGGRLGDLYGHRRLFLIGIVEFTVASLLCGLSWTKGLLIAARAVQGLGAAVVSVVVLSLVMIIFTEPRERAKAMGVIGFVLSGGGAAGVLLGGVLTDLLSWHWIFLVNVPIGIAVFFVCLRLLPGEPVSQDRPRLDVAGAVVITASLVLAVYAIVNGHQVGWATARTIGLLAAAVVLFAIFLGIEARVKAPLVPLRLFRMRNLSTANVTGILMPGAMFGWFFLSSLYLGRVLHYSPLKVGLAFLPATLIWGAASILLSDRLVMRFGLKTPLLGGLGLFVVGLMLFARAPVDGSYWVDILPGMIIMGIGGGITFNPILLAAMGDVAPTEAGLASGVVNTAFMMGGALGLSALASIAASRTDSLKSSGEGELSALTGGYHAAFIGGAIFAAAAAAVAGWFLRPSQAPAPHGVPEAAPSPSTD